MKHVETARFISKELLARDIYRLTLHAPRIAADSRAGQFVHMEVSGDGSRILKRPISISRTDPEAGTVDLVIQVIGGGTRHICEADTGDAVTLVGPLGNGFTQFEKAGSLWLIGGGVGIAPLLMVAEVYRKTNLTGCLRLFLGYACRGKAYYVHDFGQYADGVHIATEDGSLGEKGYVTALMEKALAEGSAPELILSCGPTPMLKAVQRIVNFCGIPCRLSLEARMACGTGVCLGCVVRTGTEEHWGYNRVCSDGPVFDSREVMLDE